MPIEVCECKSDDVKTKTLISKLNVERRSISSDRRFNDGNNYNGPARRMTIDRRK